MVAAHCQGRACDLDREMGPRPDGRCMRQRIYRSLSIVFWFGLSYIWLWAGSKSRVGQTLLLDDFETLDSIKRWEGDIQLSKGRSSHGQYSALVRLVSRLLKNGRN